MVQAAVLISHHVDFLKKSLNNHSYLEVPTESLMEVSIEKLVELGITLTFFSTWGIGMALGLSKNAIKSRYLKNMKIRKDELFEELISQIR